MIVISVTEKSKNLIKDILDSNRLSSGKLVREFEKKFADLIGTKYAVAVSTGTDAVALALSVLHDLGAERGDEIIVPALSFVATGNAIFGEECVRSYIKHLVGNCSPS